MIETLDYGVQFLVLLACGVYIGFQAARTRDRGWLILGFFYTCYAMGDLYWLLCMLLEGETPKVFYISDLSWYASYIFLSLLLRLVREGQPPVRSLLPWLAPAFTAAAGLFFSRWGDNPGNLITAVLMGWLGFLILRGLLEEDRPPVRRLHLVLAAFFLCEYGMWFASCFWSGDSPANPYFWFDSALTVILALLVPVYGKGAAG